MTCDSSNSTSKESKANGCARCSPSHVWEQSFALQNGKHTPSCASQSSCEGNTI